MATVDDLPAMEILMKDSILGLFLTGAINVVSGCRAQRPAVHSTRGRRAVSPLSLPTL